MPSLRRLRQRSDPYRNYKFRVKFDGHPVAGVTHVSALARTTEVVEYREGTGGGDTQHLPGRTRYDAITLTRGVDQDEAFKTWADKVGEGSTPPSPLRKEVRIEVLDRHGDLVVAYTLHRSWPSHFAALDGLETGPRRHLTQSLTLQYEGWDRELPAPRHGKAPSRRR
jgi:phage tail-like protein